MYFCYAQGYVVPQTSPDTHPPINYFEPTPIEPPNLQDAGYAYMPAEADPVVSR